MSKINSLIFLGNKKDVNKKKLVKHDIKYILNCAAGVNIANDLTKNYNYLHLNLDDYNKNKQFYNELPKAMEFMRKCMSNNKKILVHCRAGINRSATILIWYLATEEKMGFDEAYKFVKSKRSKINPKLLKIVK
jgi:protein-tyrosine phosphatase